MPKARNPYVIDSEAEEEDEEIEEEEEEEEPDEDSVKGTHIQAEFRNALRALVHSVEELEEIADKIFIDMRKKRARSEEKEKEMEKPKKRLKKGGNALTRMFGYYLGG